MNDARNSPKCTQRRSKNKTTDVMIYEGDVLLSNGGGTDKHKRERRKEMERLQLAHRCAGALQAPKRGMRPSP